MQSVRTGTWTEHHFIRLQVREAIPGAEVCKAVQVTISVCGRIFCFFVHQLRWIVDMVEPEQMAKFELDDCDLGCFECRRDFGKLRTIKRDGPRHVNTLWFLKTCGA